MGRDRRQRAQHRVRADPGHAVGAQHDDSAADLRSRVDSAAANAAARADALAAKISEAADTTRKALATERGRSEEGRQAVREELRAELLEARQKTAAMESKHSTDMIDVGSRLKKEGPSPASLPTHLALERPTTPVWSLNFACGVCVFQARSVRSS